MHSRNQPRPESNLPVATTPEGVSESEVLGSGVMSAQEIDGGLLYTLLFVNGGTSLEFAYVLSTNNSPPTNYLANTEYWEDNPSNLGKLGSSTWTIKFSSVTATSGPPTESGWQTFHCTDPANAWTSSYTPGTTDPYANQGSLYQSVSNSALYLRVAVTGSAISLMVWYQVLTTTAKDVQPNGIFNFVSGSTVTPPTGNTAYYYKYPNYSAT